MSERSPGRALLFDVGDVLLHHNWRLVEMLTERTGRPFNSTRDPVTDPHWTAYDTGEITQDLYWDRTAQSAGLESRIALWRLMSSVLGESVFAEDSIAFATEALDAQVRVAILSNDLIRSSSRAWVDSMSVLKLFDPIVDCTEFGTRKPAAAPYLHAASLLGLPPEEVVFLDDMEYCIEGARAVNMQAVLVDPFDRAAAFEQARKLVGMP